MRVVAEQQLPFELTVPNLVTRDAMAEAETILSKRRARFNTPQALFEDVEKNGH